MSTPAISPCYCYIVECSDGTFYTGWTTDPEERLRAHNAGRGARYTRARRPVQLVMLEEQANRQAAMKRERVIKRMTREKKTTLIERMQRQQETATEPIGRIPAGGR